jgi:hypothetical protein
VSAPAEKKGCEEDATLIDKIKSDTKLLQHANRIHEYFHLLMDASLLQQPQTYKDGWGNITSASRHLFESGWYEKVATKHKATLIDAWHATMNINGHWFLKNDVTVSGSWPFRQTMNGDVFEVQKRRWLLTANGFVDIDSAMFIGDA